MEEAKNGTMYEDDNYYYYVPDNYNSSTNITFYITKGQNSESGSTFKRELLNEGSDSIMVLPKNPYTSPSTSVESINKFIQMFETKNNITFSGNNVGVTGWSIGADYAARVAQESYLSGNVKVSSIIAIDGAYNGWSIENSSEDFLKKFGSDGGTLISVSAYDNRTKTWKQCGETVANAGGTAVVFSIGSTSDAGHAWANTLAFRCNVAGILSGGIINPDYNTGNSRIQYKIEYYDKENGEWIELTPEQLQEKIAKGEIDSSALQNTLDQLSSVTIDTVQSDVPTLQTYMDAIHRKIESSNFFTFSANGLQSNTKIPVSEQAVTLQFYRACAALLGKLVNDTNYILTLGSKINEMDENLMKRIDAIAPPVEAEEVPEVTGSNTSTATTSERSTSENVLAGMGTGATIGAAIGATIGTIIEPGVGTVLLGAAGAAIGTLVGAGIALWRQFISGKDTYFFGSNPGSSDTTPTDSTTETTGNGGR